MHTSQVNRGARAPPPAPPGYATERDPGALNHSRWFTTANRILRFYVSQANPFTSLILFAEFIMKVYAPMWFRIKCNSSVVNGAKRLQETIQKTRCIPSEIQEVVLPIIQRNGYFSQSENILLAMVNDENMIVCELGLRTVLRSRKLCEGPLTKIRGFKVPKISFDADIYYEMIDWQNVEVTPPPLLHDFTNDEIDKAIVEGNPLMLGIKLNIPCHTQAVERMIKLVTVASIKLCGQTSRDGYIRAALQSRKVFPTFKTKNQFQVQVFSTCLFVAKTSVCENLVTYCRCELY